MIIHTPASRRAVGRHLDHRLAQVEQVDRVLAKMAQGNALYRLDQLGQWALSNGEPVKDGIARKVVQHPNIVGVGDNLFPEINELSQTFRYVGSVR